MRANHRKPRSREIRRVMHLIDRLEEETGAVCPDWMLLDHLAAACQDYRIPVRHCCRRKPGSRGILSDEYLVLNNEMVITMNSTGPIKKGRLKRSKRRIESGVREGCRSGRPAIEFHSPSD